MRELLRISGLSLIASNHFYWMDRHAYDEGKLTGLEFWRKIARDAGLTLGESADRRAESVGCAHVDSRRSGDAGVATRDQATRACSRPSSPTWGTRFTSTWCANLSGSSGSMCWCGAINFAWPSPTRPSIATLWNGSERSRARRCSSTTRLRMLRPPRQWE